MVDNQVDVFVPGLNNTQGWVALSREKQDQLLRRTSNIIQYKRMEGLGAIGACIELAEVERLLANESMSMRSYIHTVFGASAATAYRRLADLKELRKHWDDKLIEAVASKGATLLRGASGVGMKDLIRVAKALPPPKSREDKVIEGYVTNHVRKHIADDRSQRRKGKATLRFDAEESAKMAFNHVLRILRSTNIKTSAEQRKWLMLVVGWTMEARAISGTLRCGRISIPEGTIAKVGRPRKSPTKKPD